MKTGFAVLAFVLSYITSPPAQVNCAPNVWSQSVDIDLSSYHTNQTKLFVRYLNLTDGAVVTVENAPDNQGFFVIQAHSLENNVSLSKTPNCTIHMCVVGTNIGLVEANLRSNKSYHYYVQRKEHKLTFNILLTVVVYEKTDPIPGGCNMVFPTEIAPYQLVSYDDNIIKVDIQPAAAYNIKCESNPTRLRVYRIYLSERVLDEASYFEGIRSMLTVDLIREKGRLMPEPIGRSIFRRYYSAYPGTGSIYAAIATYKNGSAAYVPAVTYACNINRWDEDCIGPVTVEWKIVCAVLLFIGLFMCYFGHKFFKTQMFLFGFVFGGFISYVLLSISATVSIGEVLGISLVFGFVYGVALLIFWWRFGSPILSVFLPVAFTGYITSCIVFYTDFGDIRIFQYDVNYWSIFFAILIPTTTLLLVTTMFANILTCSVLGACAITASVDHYVGGNLHYIIVNNIRRATVYNFNLAIVDPPFQYRDVALICAWVILVVTGVRFQLKRQNGRPPFPPPLSHSPERTPLLSAIYT